MGAQAKTLQLGTLPLALSLPGTLVATRSIHRGPRCDMYWARSWQQTRNCLKGTLSAGGGQIEGDAQGFWERGSLGWWGIGRLSLGPPHLPQNSLGEKVRLPGGRDL